MSQIQDVKNATDIVQLIGERRQLQRSGANWRGLCPFHSEKSPSFFVNEQLQRYKCFGCGESGDIFTFLEKYEGMTFSEALHYLADRAGIVLTQTNFSPEDDQRKRVLEMLELSKEYFHYLLTQHSSGEKARQYLKDRGMTADSIKLFQVGYALPSWDGLLKYLRDKKKYSVSDIEAAGLIIPKSSGRSYDRFRDRIMFPLTDHRGRVVGFSGRVLEKDVKEAKYINSSETMVYHKSQMLYGYSQLYQYIRKENEVVVVEGEFDVITSAQAHVNHVVAVKGSVLTEEHMKLLSRTVSKVILSFDTDKAGIAATKRAIEVAKPFGLELRVLQLPPEVQAKDPDEIARKQPGLWREVVHSSISVYDFFLHVTLEHHNPRTPEGKRQIIDELAPIFGYINHAVELDFYTRKLAEALQVKPELVQADLARFKGAAKKGLGNVARSTLATQSNQPQAETRKSRLEEYALFLLFNSEPSTVLERAEKLKHMSFARAGVKSILTALLKLQSEYVAPEFAKSLADDLQKILLDVTLNQAYIELLPQLNIDKEWQKIIAELIDLDIAEEIQRISKQLEALESETSPSAENEAQQAELLRKIVQLRARKTISKRP